MSEVKQLHMFGPNLNPISRLKSAMRQSIRESKFSRDQIVDRINQIAASDGMRAGRGESVTAAMLDAWVAESKTHMIPVQLLPAFCMAAGGVLPLRVLAECLGAEVVDAKDAKILSLAKLELESRRLSKRQRRLRAEIEEYFDV